MKTTALLYANFDREHCSLFPSTEMKRAPTLMETAMFYVPCSAFSVLYPIITYNRGIGKGVRYSCREASASRGPIEIASCPRAFDPLMDVTGKLLLLTAKVLAGVTAVCLRELRGMWAYPGIADKHGKGI